MGVKTAVDKILSGEKLSLSDLTVVLESDGEDLSILYDAASGVREIVFGKRIFLRGIIEFSNFCRKRCSYCGISCYNGEIVRYRIPEDEILDVLSSFKALGIGTVVLQSGEDILIDAEFLGRLIRKIKERYGLKVTLSVGERSDEEYKYWKMCGVDRYLLRYETSDEKLYSELHGGESFMRRVAILKILKRLGIETGSGFLIGLPGQTLKDLAKELLFTTGLELDMIGCGPFIPHPKTPLRNAENPFDKDITFKVMALLRLLNPYANIPATTAFDAFAESGREFLIDKCGMNVFMPNMTPVKYYKDYNLYPGKESIKLDVSDFVNRIREKGYIPEL